MSLFTNTKKSFNKSQNGTNVKVHTSWIAHWIHYTRNLSHSNCFLGSLLLKLLLSNDNCRRETQIISSSATVDAVGEERAALNEQPLWLVDAVVRSVRGALFSSLQSYFQWHLTFCTAAGDVLHILSLLFIFNIYYLQQRAHRCPPGVRSQVVGLPAQGGDEAPPTVCEWLIELEAWGAAAWTPCTWQNCCSACFWCGSASGRLALTVSPSSKASLLEPRRTSKHSAVAKTTSV